MYLTASLGLDQSNTRDNLDTTIKILIRQFACAKINIKQKSAKALNKD